MSQEQSTGRWKVLSVILAAVLLGGGFTIWKLATPSKRGASPAQEAEAERRRVAALDPAFDPAKPGGGVAGMVKDADGRPVAGAMVAATRQRGRDELPAFSRPIPRTAVTGGDGRFQLTDVLPGDYGLTATRPTGRRPARPRWR